MNERRVVESLVLVSLLINLVKRGVSDLADRTSVETAIQLQRVVKDIMASAPPNARDKIARRVNGHANRCIQPHLSPATPIILLGLATFHILEHLIELEYMIIGHDSPLSQALDAILPSLEPAAAMPQNMEKGREMAALIFAEFQSGGLFRDIVGIQ